MLQRLLVDNLTVIGRAEIDFAPGLTVITGETGAGKTMLTTAVRLVAGEKADDKLVGPRGPQAYVEAEFDDAIPSALLDVANEDEPLIIGRKLNKGGSSRALCGGRSCSADQLKQASEELISLTGQHAARKLVDPASQMELVDRAGGLLPLRADVASAYSNWKGAEKELLSLREALADSVRRIELLRNDVEAVRAVDPQPEEVDILGSERERLAYADSLRDAALFAAENLNGDEQGVSDRIARVIAELEGVSEHDEDMARLAIDAADAAERLAEVAREARSLVEAYDADPERLNEIEHRLSAISDLKRRFSGLDIESILARTAADEKELENLESGDERVSELEAKALASKEDYDKVAAKLTKARIKAGKALASSTEGHLHDLGLAGAKLIVEMEPVAPNARGVERIRMLLQANRGLEAAPLDKGASGGELSRVNLALLLASAPARGCFIFDEVDAGIGGDTAHIVAAKLHALSLKAQVIVVTHLAQIAVKAQQHLVVRKDHSGEHTQTRVDILADEVSRNREIARLMGADAADDQAAAEAARLVKAASVQ